jgi:hypothetical protein
VQKIFVERHSDGGVHFEFCERGDFAAGFDAPGGDDGVSRGRSERREVFEIDAGERAFAVDVGAQKRSTEGFKSLHHVWNVKCDGFAPAVRADFSPVGIESDNDAFAVYSASQRTKQAKIYFTAMEYGASNDDLRCADVGQFFGARDRANAAADANFHFVFAARAFAERFDGSVVVSFVHGGVEIDDVQPAVTAEFSELACDIGDSELTAAPVDQLYGLARLKIDAGD